MADKAWKRAERRVAGAVGGKRNPLSGATSGHTSGDVIHPVLYIEVKYKARFAITTLMQSVRAKAKEEGKLPVLALQERGKKTRYYVLDERDFDRFVEELTKR